MLLIILKLRSCFNINLYIFLSALPLIFNGCTGEKPKEQYNKVDITQAKMMLEFLTGLAKGEQVSHKIEPIIKAEGTELNAAPL